MVLVLSSALTPLDRVLSSALTPLDRVLSSALTPLIESCPVTWAIHQRTRPSSLCVLRCTNVRNLETFMETFPLVVSSAPCSPVQSRAVCTKMYQSQPYTVVRLCVCSTRINHQGAIIPCVTPIYGHMAIWYTHIWSYDHVFYTMVCSTRITHQGAIIEIIIETFLAVVSSYSSMSPFSPVLSSALTP